MKFRRALLRFSKGVNDVAKFNVRLSESQYNVRAVRFESVTLTGVANAGISAPTTTIIGINLNIPSVAYDTLTEDAHVVPGFVVPISSAPVNTTLYDSPDTRALLPVTTQILRGFAVCVRDESAGVVADRERPQFTGIAIMVRFDLDDEAPKRRLPDVEGDRFDAEHILHAEGSNRQRLAMQRWQ